MDDNPLWKRARELSEELGVDFWLALDKAQLEQNIKIWPPEWGNKILVVIYASDRSFADRAISLAGLCTMEIARDIPRVCD